MNERVAVTFLLHPIEIFASSTYLFQRSFVSKIKDAIVFLFFQAVIENRFSCSSLEFPSNFQR